MSELTVFTSSLDELTELITYMPMYEEVSFAESCDIYDEGEFWWTAKVIDIAGMTKVILSYAGYCDRPSIILESYWSRDDAEWFDWLKDKLLKAGFTEDVYICVQDYMKYMAIHFGKEGKKSA